MSWSEHVFNYCERGLDPAFWAEPFNAASNGAFLLAAIVAGRRLAALPPATREGGGWGERVALWMLVATVAAIGIGSFLFHTFATRWAMVVDVGPITVFMVAYLAFALRVFLGARWVTIGLVLPVFLVAGLFAASITCSPRALAGVTQAAPEPCFNGSLGYLPALVALVVTGLLAVRRPAARRLLLGAAAVFLVSVVLRTLDREVCAATEFLGQARGTHALWHLLNAATLHLLLSAGIGQAREKATR